MRYLLLIFIMVFSVFGDASDKYFKESLEKKESMEKKAEERFKVSVEEYELQMKTQFEAVDKIWGEHLASTQKRLVDYGIDLKSYTSIDFEEGVVEVKLITSPDNSTEENKKLLAKQMINTMKKKVEAGGDKSYYLLDDQLPYEEGDMETYVYKVVDDFELEKTEVKGKKKNILSVKVKLLPDHLEKRAEKYRYIVNLVSKDFNIEKSLIYAVIHTESYFNPMAVSPASAYGLMQLIPKAGARDAYEYITGKHLVPTPEYLFVPKNNITLGSAYLSLLQKKYFDNIKNLNNKEILSIIAYNWGVGNVKNKLEKRITVNNTAPLDLYDYVRESSYIPKETRDYIKKVLERKELYNDF